MSSGALRDQRGAYDQPCLLVSLLSEHRRWRRYGECLLSRDATRIEGVLRDYASVADSGNVMHRHFCPSCGVHLFSEAESRPHLIFVRAGSLDNPEIGKPAATIWVSQAPSWACIDDRLPRIEGQPAAGAPPPP